MVKETQSWFSPSTVWAPGLALGHQAWLHTPISIWPALPVHSEVSAEPSTGSTGFPRALRDCVTHALELSWVKGNVTCWFQVAATD